ncbi:MAG: butyrate kinase [Bacteroidales bacterium]|jgi:butyrate kinase|nr:butyrate kinase [Bacteroidales bacterium]
MISKEILVVYPESETTKIAIYRGNNVIFLKTIKHKAEELAEFKDIINQIDFRYQAIKNELIDNDMNSDAIEAVVARGGLIKPLKKAGVYLVNVQMVNDLKIGYQGVHETNLGGILADLLAKSFANAQAFLADPVVVDELEDLARVTGHPLFTRKSIFHALNQKYVARKYAKSNAKCYDDLRLVVAHVGGGGISIGAHKRGRVVDVNQAFDGGGPFALTRTGSLPVGKLIEVCFSGKYTESEIRKMVTSEGGLKAHLGTSNIHEINQRIEAGDTEAEFYAKAMGYQIAKFIGSACAVLDFNVDAIILSGQIFSYNRFTEYISYKVLKVAPIAVYQSVNDMDALAMNALLAIQGEIEINQY